MSYHVIKDLIRGDLSVNRLSFFIDGKEPTPPYFGRDGTTSFPLFGHLVMRETVGRTTKDFLVQHTNNTQP